jgi:hypothetical protein
MVDHDRSLRDRLVAMESRLETAAPPEIRSRAGRRFALSFAVAPLLILVLAGTAVAGAAIVSGAVRGYEGVENPGQPLYGAQLECMTPPQAAAYIAAHGITKVQWQVEQDDPAANTTERLGSRTVFQATAPETGVVVAGAIVDDGTLDMLVDQHKGAKPPLHCTAR